MKINNWNLLWITLDATRKDRLSCYGYEKKTTPYLDDFSKVCLKFNNAFTTSPWTYPSVASMFTGKYPSEHGAWNEELTFDKENKTFSESLKKRGYNTYLVSQNDGWINQYFGLTKGFDNYYGRDEIIGNGIGVFPPQKQSINNIFNFFFKHHLGFDFLTMKTIDKIIQSAKEPWFLYLHLVNNHLPYEPYPLSIISIIRYLSTYKNLKSKKEMSWINGNTFSKSELETLSKLYDKTLSVTDKKIKRYLNMVDLDKTIVIITADHGENIGDHGLVGHQFSLHDTLLNIPLLIYAPNIRSKQIDSLFEIKDIGGLIIDILNDDFESLPKKEYIYAEYKPVKDIYKRLKNLEKDLPSESSCIRTKNRKLVTFDNKKNELYKIENGKEKKITNPELKSDLEKLIRLKQSKLDKCDRYNLFKTNKL